MLNLNCAITKLCETYLSFFKNVIKRISQFSNKQDMANQVIASIKTKICYFYNFNQKYYLYLNSRLTSNDF